MCLTDFDLELGNALGGNVVYPSIDDLERQRGCIEECGIAEVEVTLVKVVQEPNYSRILEEDTENTDG
jgi:dipeptidase